MSDTDNTDDWEGEKTILPTAQAQAILSFSFPPGFNLDIFEETCKEMNLPASIDRESSVAGTIFVRCNSLDLKNNLSEIRRKLKIPIEKAIKNTDLSEQIKNELLKSSYFKGLIIYIQDKSKEFKKNKISKEDIINELYTLHGSFLGGKEGITKIAELFFSENSEQIINNYQSMQKYLIQHFALDFFIEQQIEQNYFLTIFVKSTDKKGFLKEIIVPEKGLTYSQKSISPPKLGTLNNIYVNEKDRNSIIIVDSNKANIEFIKKLISVKSTTDLLLFMNFIMEKQKAVLSIDFEKLRLDFKKIESEILNATPNEIQKIFDQIIRLENLIFQFQTGMVIDMKIQCDSLKIKKNKINTEIFSSLFNEIVSSNGEQIGLNKFNPPLWLENFGYATEYDKYENHVYSLYNNINEILNNIKDLKKYLLEYKHILEIRNLEKRKYYLDLIINGFSGLGKLVGFFFGK